MADNSLRVVVRKNPFDEPLLRTEEAATIEIRDSNGALLCLIVTVPGHPVFVVSKADHEDFASFVSNMGIKITELK